MTFEWTILQKIQEWFGCEFMDWLMPKISFIGEVGMIWILISVILLFNRKYRKLGILMIIGLIVELIVGNGILKHLVSRLRPIHESNHANWVQYLGSEFALKVEAPIDQYSFPSGHAFSCAICATLMFLYNKRLGILGIVITLLMGFSRVYLCVHFFTDVLGGIVLGIVFGLIIWKVDKVVTLKIKERKKSSQ